MALTTTTSKLQHHQGFVSTATTVGNAKPCNYFSRILNAHAHAMDYKNYMVSYTMGSRKTQISASQITLLPSPCNRRRLNQRNH